MDCLEMPVRTFFSVLKEGRLIKTKDLAFMMHEMCDVVTCANVTDIKYIESLKTHFWNIYSDFKPHVDKQGLVFDAASPETGKILLDIARQKMRLHGYH